MKTQIHTLKRAIEKKRDEHEQNAAEHSRLVGEIEEKMDWLTAKEAEFVKSRPLLKTAVDDVEARLKEHHVRIRTCMEIKISLKLDLTFRKLPLRLQNTLTKFVL